MVLISRSSDRRGSLPIRQNYLFHFAGSNYYIYASDKTFTTKRLICQCISDRWSAVIAPWSLNNLIFQRSCSDSHPYAPLHCKVECACTWVMYFEENWSLVTHRFNVVCYVSVNFFLLLSWDQNSGYWTHICAELWSPCSRLQEFEALYDDWAEINFTVGGWICRES